MNIILFQELDLRLSIVSPMGGALVPTTISTSCHGDVDKLRSDFLLFVFWLCCFGGMTFME